jgi:serine/threonine-protein phosphatase PGAM5
VSVAGHVITRHFLNNIEQHAVTNRHLNSIRSFKYWALAFALAWTIIGVARAADSGATKSFTRTIYLVRHGAYVADPKADPQLGPGLTALGIAQARLVAARLRGMNVNFESMTSSTMTRAKETAAVMHESLPDVPVGQSALFVECTPPAFRALKDESVEEQAACAKRLDTAFSERFIPAGHADGSDLIVAHGNVIRYLITKALGVDTRAWLGMTVAHASLTVIRVRPDGTMSVLAVGDAGHLPPNMQSWGGEGDPQLVVPK